MPEGPEIRRAADAIQEAVGGQEVHVEFGLPDLKRWETRFSPAHLTAIETHGKAILSRFDNGLTIFSHNQLYGRWVCCPAGETPKTRRQLRLAIHAAKQSALLYSASNIAVLRDAEMQTHPYLAKLGPDVLNPVVTTDKIMERLLSTRFRNRQLGAFLTDQSFVAGLGNYLRCEILFSASCHPKTRPASLNHEQLSHLAEMVLALPRQSYALGGITNDLATAQRLMQNGADFEAARFKVFRREGQPCYRCGTAIVRKKLGGQACYLCPACQQIL